MSSVDDFATILSRDGVEISGSDNKYLQDLTASVNACVTLYNTNAGKPQKIRALDDILAKAAFWLTSKPPRMKAKNGKGFTKNPARWDAMTRLAERVAEEAQKLGVTVLYSPSNFREIKGDPNLGQQSYWLERVDEHHRPGYLLSREFEQWVALVDTTDSFWTYVSTRLPMAKRGGTASVRFLDKDARVPYKLSLENNIVKIHSGVDVFDTEKDETAYSKEGFAVFVCALNVYASSHWIGRFHHSSFFSGLPVVAAGEIVAYQGEIRLITSKSGHYRPTPADMLRMVQTHQFIKDDVLIIPEMSPAAVTRPCYKVGNFRRGDTGPAFYVSKADFLKKMPGWLNGSEGVTKILDKMPG